MSGSNQPEGHYSTTSCQYKPLAPSGAVDVGGDSTALAAPLKFGAGAPVPDPFAPPGWETVSLPDAGMVLDEADQVFLRLQQMLPAKLLPVGLPNGVPIAGNAVLHKLEARPHVVAAHGRLR
jgi:hypothetical protein